MQRNQATEFIPPSDLASLDQILKGTSRAFYLTLSVLPAAARTPLSLAYLIARAADTVADAEASVQVVRRALLLDLQSAVVGAEASRWNDKEDALRHLCPENPRERELLDSIPILLALLEQRPRVEADAIRQVVGTLIDGMLWDQQLFDSDREGRAETGLRDEEFEKYTYLVAGCVGPFWSTVCALSHSRLGHLAGSRYYALAAEFGKGLQWVNILRDVPNDQLNRRFYLPTLEGPDFRDRFLAQSRRGIDALATASAYPLLFPRGFLRHRMAVFWPLVLGLRTLEKLLGDGGPRPDARVKVQRWEVLLWVACGPLLVLSDTVLSLVLGVLRRRAERALTTLEDSHATIS
jgi:farnesyl-diphosphate farnesyltransferase